MPDSVVGVLDEASNAVESVVSFLDPTSGGAAEEVAKTEDHMLNAILNLDNIVDAHMSSNGHTKVETVVPVPQNESKPPKTKVKKPAGKELDITPDDIIEDPELLMDYTIQAEDLVYDTDVLDYAMINRMRAPKE